MYKVTVRECDCECVHHDTVTGDCVHRDTVTVTVYTVSVRQSYTPRDRSVAVKSMAVQARLTTGAWHDEHGTTGALHNTSSTQDERCTQKSMAQGERGTRIGQVHCTKGRRG